MGPGRGWGTCISQLPGGGGPASILADPRCCGRVFPRDTGFSRPWGPRARAGLCGRCGCLRTKDRQRGVCGDEDRFTAPLRAERSAQTWLFSLSFGDTWSSTGTCRGRAPRRLGVRVLPPGPFLLSCRKTATPASRPGFQVCVTVTESPVSVCVALTTRSPPLTPSPCRRGPPSKCHRERPRRGTQESPQENAQPGDRNVERCPPSRWPPGTRTVGAHETAGRTRGRAWWERTVGVHETAGRTRGRARWERRRWREAPTSAEQWQRPIVQVRMRWGRNMATATHHQADLALLVSLAVVL